MASNLQPVSNPETVMAPSGDENLELVAQLAAVIDSYWEKYTQPLLEAAFLPVVGKWALEIIDAQSKGQKVPGLQKLTQPLREAILLAVKKVVEASRPVVVEIMVLEIT